MATFKNTNEHQVDIPLLELHVRPGETFEVPEPFAAQFEADPAFTSSRTKHPDVTVDPAVAEAATTPVTGPIATYPPGGSAPAGIPT